LLTEATYDMIGTMAENYANFVQAAETLRPGGRVITTHTGARKPHPLVAIEKNCFEMFARAYKELRIAEEKVTPHVGGELEEFLRTQ
jgi:hypothetical protein